MLLGRLAKSLRVLPGCEIKSMKLMFKTKMFIYQSKADLDQKTLFCEITHHLDPEIW